MAGQYDKDRSDVNVAGRMQSWPQPGLNHVGQYQISGVPYVTSSQSLEVGATPIAVRFPRVTRFVNVTNFSGGAMRMGFTANGINGLGQFSGSAVGGGTLTIHNPSHDN